MIKAKFETLKRKYNFKTVEEPQWEERILPYRKAPVLVNRGNGLELRMMNFSLIPSWSKESRLKFATHNARIESILEKPTWKNSFLTSRCLVPLTDFIEPIYSGPFAGNMVNFHDDKEEILTAAGLWSEWLNKETGEIIESFAIITGEPDPFVRETGHDRQPIFIESYALEEWSVPQKAEGPRLMTLLKENRSSRAFSASIDRPLKNKKKS